MNSPVTVASGNVNDFWLIYNGTGGINNNTGNAFTGVIFAPEATVTLNYHVTGAVIGGWVQLNGSSWVNFPTSGCLAR